jgi:hypothetical protein
MDIHMILSYFETVFKKAPPSARSLTEIIEDIRNGLVADLVRQIRDDTAEIKIKELKLRLPAFLPSLVDQSPTGIVYFDIDRKNNIGLDFESLKERIESIPECIFSFTSPSKGLKFGIKTNFILISEDAEHVRQLYFNVHKVTTELFRKLLTTRLKASHRYCCCASASDCYCNHEKETNVFFPIVDPTLNLLSS